MRRSRIHYRLPAPRSASLLAGSLYRLPAPRSAFLLAGSHYRLPAPRSAFLLAGSLYRLPAPRSAFLLAGSLYRLPAPRSAFLLAGSLVAVVAALSIPARAWASPPKADEGSAHAEDRADIPRTAPVRGRVGVAGTRAPVPEAKVIVVNAPPEARVGGRADEPLDPAGVEWVYETLTDEEGRFEFTEIPPGKVRVVVVVAGYERLEIYFASSAGNPAELALYVRPTQGRFRTEVVIDRHPELPRAEHRVEAERARVYPGSAGDPVRATQNLPGVARSPGSLGLMAIRGGDPRQTGIYVDGHPVPRAFHVLPIAAIVDPSMLDRVELTPGNFDAAYGGFSGGLLELQTRRFTDLQGIHGEAHVDLFDVGGGFWGPVGRGGVGVAFRRAHVGDIVKLADDAIGKTGILVPNYWDYFGRFDMPIGRRHLLGVKAFGAGDTLKDTTDFGGGEIEVDFGTAFHRFDLGYAYEGQRLRGSVSGALLLDTNIDDRSEYWSKSRRGQTSSLRTSLSYRLSRRATLLTGLDVVRTRALRQLQSSNELNEYEAKHWRFGTWLGVALQMFPRTGALVIRPQVRLNVFGTTSESRVGVDPRLDVRARVHPRVELFAATGVYSAPHTVFREEQLGLISDSSTSTAHVVIPDWLIKYFDPGVESEAPDGFLLVTRTYQSSVGVQVELPWATRLRATTFWREATSVVRGWQTGDSTFFGPLDLTIRTPIERAYGLELLLDRSLAERIHGMIGYTLLRARASEIETWLFDQVHDANKLVPASFDQRHNLVAVLVFELPRRFRLGARFRVVSGNPERPVIGTTVEQGATDFGYRPIYGELGSSYGPLFHQLDLRLDKTWLLRRAAIVGYLDVQNVYNRMYPEIWVYSIDWSERGQRIGLPIFPSLGVRVEF